MFGLDSIKLIIFGSMILAIVTLGATSAVLWSRIDAVKAERDANAHLLESANAQVLALAKSVNEHQEAIQQRDDAIKAQNAEIARWKADSLAVKQTNDELVKAGRQDAERRLSDISAQEAEARAHPEEIHKLSPRVLAIGAGLRDE